MQIDIGEVRFLTKVAEKSPRGLRLLLFKEKSTGKEKLVFVVKTASEDIDKLALSKMTWQVEQSKHAPRIVIVRLLILPEGSNEFFQSESGLLMNEEKDRNSLDALARQKSIEIFFFNYEAEFHSKIELLTTYNMSKTAQALMELNPLIDEGKLIVKSENLSESDIKNAMSGKVKESKLKDKDLMDSIQKKMPVISSSIPKTKPEETSKTSIKSNDMAVSGSFGTPTAKKPVSKKNDLVGDDLKKATGKPVPRITPEELLKSIPPSNFKAKDVFADALNRPPVESKSSISSDDLLKGIDANTNQLGGISPEELLKSIPPTLAPSSLTAEELLNSIPPTLAPSSLTAEELLNSIPPAPSLSSLSTEELLKSLGGDTMPAEGGLQAQDLLDSLSYGQSTVSAESGFNANDLFNMSPLDGTDTGLGKDNLFDAFKDEEEVYFIDNTPTTEIKRVHTQEFKKDELLDALKSQPSPLKPSEEVASTPASVKSTPVKEPDSKKTNGINIKTTNPMADNDKKEEASSISEEDLLKILNGEM